MKFISVILYVAFLSGAIDAQTANACMICVPYPKTTLADRLNESESVVFAREKGGKPYFFGTVELLKGRNAGDYFKAYIYSSDRRKLSKNPNDAAVFGKNDSGDDWQYISYADGEYQTFIREIILRANSWQSAEAAYAALISSQSVWPTAICASANKPTSKWAGRRMHPSSASPAPYRAAKFMSLWPTGVSSNGIACIS
jgi:hypothetical protein